ncbi:MAG: hydantoinase B/oxoprolinase family protein, partial [Mycobacteriaceae bacterium]|nr:hydantoinase B/oxoprolinase family protein [Mycobacteriaceae bacterium]
PQGALGGAEGAKAHAVIRRADGREEVIPSKMMTTLMRGDRVVIKTAGGGGNGAPDARDPAAMAIDVADGKVSGRWKHRL